MEHLFNLLLQAALDGLGIDMKRQFLLALLAYLAAFVVWSVRPRAYGFILSALFAILGVSLMVLLFTESVTVRWASFLICSASAIFAFTWQFVRTRRART